MFRTRNANKWWLIIIMSREIINIRGLLKRRTLAHRISRYSRSNKLEKYKYGEKLYKISSSPVGSPISRSFMLLTLISLILWGSATFYLAFECKWTTKTSHTEETHTNDPTPVETMNARLLFCLFCLFSHNTNYLSSWSSSVCFCLF